jgi:hypothetical protein
MSAGRLMWQNSHSFAQSVPLPSANSSKFRADLGGALFARARKNNGVLGLDIGQASGRLAWPRIARLH